MWSMLIDLLSANNTTTVTRRCYRKQFRLKCKRAYGVSWLLLSSFICRKQRTGMTLSLHWFIVWVEERILLSIRLMKLQLKFLIQSSQTYPNTMECLVLMSPMATVILHQSVGNVKYNYVEYNYNFHPAVIFKNWRCKRDYESHCWKLFATLLLISSRWLRLTTSRRLFCMKVCSYWGSWYVTVPNRYWM